MVESVFIEMLEKGAVSKVIIEEALPRKGKPAKKQVGSTTIWLVTVMLNNDESIALTSARGGSREWASLDNLTKWLRSYGVTGYSVNLLTTDQLLQQNLSFVAS